MESYKFKTMTGVNGEMLYTVFQKLIYNEQIKNPLFDRDEYKWIIGYDVFARLRTTINLDPYSISDSIDKYLGIDVKVFPSKTIVPTAIFLDKKNRIMPYRNYVNSIYGTKMFEMEDGPMYSMNVACCRADMITRNRSYISMSKKDTPKNVIFNDPATIVYWEDGTRTVVKAEDEPFDPEKGLAMAIAKRHLGNEGNYYDIFREWLPKEVKGDSYED